MASHIDLPPLIFSQPSSDGSSHPPSLTDVLDLCCWLLLLGASQIAPAVGKIAYLLLGPTHEETCPRTAKDLNWKRQNSPPLALSESFAWRPGAPPESLEGWNRAPCTRRSVPVHTVSASALGLLGTAGSPGLSTARLSDRTVTQEHARLLDRPERPSRYHVFA